MNNKTPEFLSSLFVAHQELSKNEGEMNKLNGTVSVLEQEVAYI